MNITVKKLIATAIFISLLALTALLLGESQANGKPASEGADLFKAKCAACHGADASGNTAMGKRFNIHDLRSAEVQSQSDGQLATTIGKGKGKMPAYEKSLSTDQINQLVAFIRELAKPH